MKTLLRLSSDQDAVFVNPPPSGTGLNEATIEPPLGLAYLAGMLEREGFKCSIIDAYALMMNTKEVIHHIPERVRLVGFYMNSSSYSSILELVTFCRKVRPKAITLVGGPLPSAVPRRILEEIPCHGLVQGEGEYAVVRIMKNIAMGAPPFDSDVPNAAFRDSQSGEIVVNPVARIEDLDRIPFPAHHLLPSPKKYKSRARRTPVMAMVTSRGCSFACSFCSKDVFHRKVTFRSVENVLSEIDYLIERFGMRQIDILDDNFALGRTRLEKILDSIIERNYGLAINLQLGIRAEIVDEVILQKMKAAGVYKVAFGIESVDSEVLRLCRKELDFEKVEFAVRVANELGLITYGFFIIGLPGETDEGFERTLEFARRMNFDVANFCMAIPFVGTELYEQVKQNGRFLVNVDRNIDQGFYGGTVFFEHGDMKAEDVLRRYKKAYRQFYSIPRQFKMLTTIRSWPELLWTLEAGVFVLKGIFRRSS